MFSYKVISSWQKQRPRKRKNVFKLPPEVTNLVFYPLEEKVVEDESNQVEGSSFDEKKIQQVVNEVLNDNYKNRTADFYDEVNIQSFEEEEEEENSSQSENSNNTPQKENNLLSISNSISYTYCDDSNQKEIISKKKRKQKDIIDRFGQDLTNSFLKKQTKNLPDEQIYQKELVIKQISKDQNKNDLNQEECENQFRRGAHYFCTFPKRKPNPVTPDMKRKIGKQREFDGKFNYYAGAYSSDSDSDYEDDDFKKHQRKHHQKEKLNDYNKYDFNGHFRKKKHYSDSEDNNDPRYYKPYIPETTINPRVVSGKRCRKILGKKNNKSLNPLTPKEHPQSFNHTNIYLPPTRFEKSIFYPKVFPYNLESEDSFLKHPNSPRLDKVKKYNNKLFESNIHFYDFDDMDYNQKPRSQSATPTSPLDKKSKNQDIHYDLRRDDYQSHLHYYDKNTNQNTNKIEDASDTRLQNLIDARRFPENYLQSIADE